MTENCFLMTRIDDWKMLSERNYMIYRKVVQVDVCWFILSLCIMLYLPLGWCTWSPVQFDINCTSYMWGVINGISILMGCFFSGLW